MGLQVAPGPGEKTFVAMESLMKRLGWLAVVLGFLTPAGCSVARVAGGMGLDAGTLGVRGVESGPGGQVEVMGYQGMGKNRIGFGPSLQIAGYSTDGDGDPMVFTSLELRLRRQGGSAPLGGFYWELGSGFGLAWAPTLQRAAVPLQGEAGLRRELGGVHLSLGVRERFLFLAGTGSPPLDAFNALHLVGGISLELGPGG